VTSTTLVDTGFLVSLFARNERRHTEAQLFLNENRQLELYTIWPVITEACFFLDHNGKDALLDWIHKGGITVVDITYAQLPEIRKIIKKYSNLDPDFTDAAVIAIANAHSIIKILTVDVRDFTAYRLKGNQTFERLWI
jgi:predicted nucleic acid-binding protein